MVNKNLESIYLDYAATSPVDPRVVTKIHQCLNLEGGLFANAASNHLLGESASAVVEEARSSVANLIGTVPRNIIFTSGATEAINLALKGTALYYADKGKHIITSSSEHKAVLETCEYLESMGFLITYLNPQVNGLLDINQLEKAIRSDTTLVSIMQVNNETGVIQDIKAIGSLTRSRGIFFHVDAAQSVGKIPVNVQNCSIDLLSMTAHKFFGPKGIGALFIGDNPRVRLMPQMHGGSQERKLRAGTLATHQIAGFGEACFIADKIMQEEVAKIVTYRNLFWEGIKDLPEVYLNCDLLISVPHIINIRFQGVDSLKFQKGLKMCGLAISAASACQSTHLEPSYVLQAMGYTKDEAKKSLRFSFGRFTTIEDIQRAILIIREQYLSLRRSCYG